MSELSSELQKVHDASVSSIEQCDKYYFNDGVVASFDSAIVNPENLPDVLVNIFDSVGQDCAEKIDKAVNLGINIYRARNGGDNPDPSVIATALASGSYIAKQSPTDIYKIVEKFDSANHLNYEQAAIVPAMTALTITNIIATALPIFALLPNPTGSVRVPIAIGRLVTDKTFGAMKKGDYLDGPNAAHPYAEGRFTFALANTSGTNYAVALHTSYADFALKTPDTTSPKLPILSGNVSIRLNGVELAHTRADVVNTKQTGNVNAQIKDKSVVIAGTAYSLSGATVNLTNGTITAVTNIALPAGAILTAHVIADWDAKDNNGRYLIDPVGVDLNMEYDSIQAAPVVFRIKVAHSANTQYARELGLGFAGVALHAVQNKVYLEQTTRLLREGKERAKLSGRIVKSFDMSRGVTGNLAPVANTTGDLFGEIMKHIASAKQQINQASGNASVSFSLYVGNLGQTLFSQLPPDKFKSTGIISSYNEIVRIGTLSDGTDVYHTPTKQGIVIEGNTTAEMALFGKGSEPLRSPFVGTIAEPPTLREATADSRESNYTSHANMAAEQNPNDRYAEQCALINVINIPPM